VLQQWPPAQAYDVVAHWALVVQLVAHTLLMHA
jgi:hypothetical protein